MTTPDYRDADRRMSESDRRIGAAEEDIKALTRNLAVLTRDVTAMSKSWEEVTTLVRDQAVQSRDIRQAISMAEMALKRHDELKVQVTELRGELNVHRAIEGARLGMMQALLKYWPIWMPIAALSLLSGLLLSHVKIGM